MTEYAAALKSFYSEFLPAFELNSIPDDVDIPYITYPINEPSWNAQGNSYCQIWYPKEHLVELMEVADNIMATIGEGLKIQMPGGYLMIYLQDLKAQIITEEEAQSAYISLSINVYHKPGI